MIHYSTLNNTKACCCCTSIFHSCMNSFALFTPDSRRTERVHERAHAFTSDFWRVNNLLMWFDTNAACNRAHVQFHPCCQFWWDFLPLEEDDSTVFSLSSHNYCYCHHLILIKTEIHLHFCRHEHSVYSDHCSSWNVLTKLETSGMSDIF